jgi:hypothetical protein
MIIDKIAILINSFVPTYIVNKREYMIKKSIHWAMGSFFLLYTRKYGGVLPQIYFI